MTGMLARGRTGGAAVVALALALGDVPAASANVISTVTGGCGQQKLEQPFLRWLDPAAYTLAPDGGLEGAGTGWTLTGGAAVKTGNETFYVRSSTDRRSLALPSGSSARTPWMCVSLTHPTLRLFATNSGSLLSTLKVEVLYRTTTGAVATAPVGVLTGTASWQPTLPLPVLANLTAPLGAGGSTSVAFRFTPVGLSSGWRIDDVYVDPYRPT